MHRSNERGFALVETIVAFMVLAIGLAAIGVAVSLAMRSDARLEARRTATGIARSRLEMAGVVSPLTPGQRSGRSSGRTWSETVTAVPTSGGTAKMPVPPAPLLAYWVEVTVESPDGGRATLAALKLAPASGP